MKSNKGQALLTVIVLTTIALSITVAISWRILSGLSRSSKTDTSARVQAAAEGGAENFLLKSNSDLEALIPICNGNYTAGIPLDCKVEFEGSGQTGVGVDTISSSAAITVSTYGSGTEKVDINTSPNEVVEVNLDGYTGNRVTVCWTGISVLQLIAYNEDSLNKINNRCRGSSCDKFNPIPEASGGGSSGYNQCINNVNVQNIEGLRIRVLGGSSVIGVFPVDGSLPIQGYQIESEALLTDLDTGEPVEKVVTVRKSLPYLPAMFDYNIYSDTGLID